MTDGKMSHEYTHGYWLEVLKSQLSAMKTQYENEVDSAQEDVDLLTMGTNAYLTSRELMQDWREDKVRETQVKENISSLSESDDKSGFGKTWDYDNPEGGTLAGIFERGIQTLFGVQPNIKSIGDGEEDSEYRGLDESNEKHHDENLGANIDLLDEGVYVGSDNEADKETIFDDTQGVKYKSKLKDGEYLEDDEIVKSELGQTYSMTDFVLGSTPGLYDRKDADDPDPMTPEEIEDYNKKFDDLQKEDGIELPPVNGDDKGEVVAFNQLSNEDISAAKMNLNDSFSGLLEEDKLRRNRLRESLGGLV